MLKCDLEVVQTLLADIWTRAFGSRGLREEYYVQRSRIETEEESRSGRARSVPAQLPMIPGIILIARVTNQVKYPAFSLRNYLYRLTNRLRSFSLSQIISLVRQARIL